MKELIGKKIAGLAVSDDQSVLTFRIEGGEDVSYYADGDCCSESWFADITGVAALLGGTVTAADSVDLEGYNVEDGRCRQDYDEAYGWKLTTDKGYADIVFRNSSNGYYGGSIELVTERLSGWLGDKAMQDITDDWTA